MVFEVFKKAWQRLLEKPVLLWGLSLLIGFLSILNTVLLGTFFVAFYPAACILAVGGARIYLRGLKKEDVNSKLIFDDGKGWKNILRIIGGMGWHDLWALIWGFVPVMRWIKRYAYKFVPYILATDGDIAPMESLKESMTRTQGYKGQLFLADVFKVLVIIAIIIVCVILHYIPVLGGLLIFIITVLTIAVYPFFCKLVDAGMFEAVTEDRKLKPSFTGGVTYCPNCGRPVPPGFRCTCTENKTEEKPEERQNVKYCSACGKQLSADATVCPFCNTPQ